MHHSAVVLSDGRVLLCGGRQSPFFLCSQLLVLDLQVHSDGANGGALSRTTNWDSGGQSWGTAPVEGVDDGSGERNGDRIGDSNRERGQETNGGRNGESEGKRNSQVVEGDRSCETSGDVVVCDSHARVSTNSAAAASNNPSTGLSRVNGTSNPHREGQSTTRRLTLAIEREEVTQFEGGHMTCSILKQSGDIPCPRWRHAATLMQIEGKKS